MEFKPLFYSFLILCIIVFIEVLVNIRKNSLLKILFLLIISSLFVMNYFAYNDITSRTQLVLVKSMRIVYLCSALIAIIHLLSPKIPKWVIILCACSVSFMVGIRLYYFSQINIERQLLGDSLVFSVANEFYSQLIVARIILLCVLIIAAGLTVYYYRHFLNNSNKDNIYYKRLSFWILSQIIPFLVLVGFGILLIARIFYAPLSPYLFSFFSCTIILSILFRPKFLNYAQVGLALVPIQKHQGPVLSPQLFNKIVFADFYYLDKEASIGQLSEKLQTTETNLREYLQQEYGMGINDFLNKYRINYMLDLLNDPESKNFTIEHLSQKSGFPSRSTMYRAYSKFHGGNPSDYINKLIRS